VRSLFKINKKKTFDGKLKTSPKGDKNYLINNMLALILEIASVMLLPENHFNNLVNRLFSQF
jgi:hypothetical protein